MSHLQHAHLHRRQHHHGNGGNGGGGAAVSVVYVTASPTFSGPIAGFSTVGVAPSPSPPSPSPSPAAASTPPAVVSPASSTAAAATSTPEPATSSVAAATSTSTPAEQSSSTSLLKSIQTTSVDSTSSIAPSSTVSTSPSSVGLSGASATTQASTTVTNNQSSSDPGLSAGAKAGIAIGVILGLLALAAVAFALYRMKRRKDEDAYVAAQNEKNPFSDSAAAAPATSSRGMVQSQAPVLPAGIFGASAPNHDLEKTAESPTNPFGPGAETIRDVHSSSGPALRPGTGDTDKVSLGVGTAAAVGGLATAAAAKRTSVPAPLKINRSQSPALTAPAHPSPAASNFSEASTMTSSMVVDANGRVIRDPVIKIHRVQLDFNPTMDDELRLAQGEIVELIHEYDDGWCLCKITRRHHLPGHPAHIARGVVPRSCLSRQPLKPRSPTRPRPQAPPAASALQSASPATSSGDVPAPAPLNTTSTPRAQSPALNAAPVKRSMSPGPYGGGPEDKSKDAGVSRSRSNSMSAMKQAAKDAEAKKSENKAEKKAEENKLEAKDIKLPIQLPTPAIEMPGSVPSSPVTRKPLPAKKD